MIDVFEHAFLVDYGLRRQEYVEAFCTVIDWDRVENRLVVCMNGLPVGVGEEAAASV